LSYKVLLPIRKLKFDHLSEISTISTRIFSCNPVKSETKPNHQITESRNKCPFGDLFIIDMRRRRVLVAEPSRAAVWLREVRGEQPELITLMGPTSLYLYVLTSCTLAADESENNSSPSVPMTIKRRTCMYIYVYGAAGTEGLFLSRGGEKDELARGSLTMVREVGKNKTLIRFHKTVVWWRSCVRAVIRRSGMPCADRPYKCSAHVLLWHWRVEPGTQCWESIDSRYDEFS